MGYMMNKKDREFKKTFKKLSGGNPNRLTDKGIWFVQRYFNKHGIDINTQTAEQLGLWHQYHMDEHSPHRVSTYVYWDKMPYTSNFIVLLKKGEKL